MPARGYSRLVEDESGNPVDSTTAHHQWQWKWYSLRPSGEIPEARSGHSLVALGRCLWLFGGEGLNGYYQQLYYLDTTTTKLNWMSVSPNSAGPTARAHHASLGTGCDMYILGGLGQDGLLGDIWQLRVTGGRASWKQIKLQGETLQPRCDHSIHIIGNDIHIFGGRIGIGQYTNELLKWDCSHFPYLLTNVNVIGNGPSPRGGHSSSIVGNRLYIVGGTGSEGRLSDVHMVDLGVPEPVWQTLLTYENSPALSLRCPLVSVGQDMYLFGHDLYVANCGARAQGLNWTTVSSEFAPAARSAHSVTLIDSTAYMFGGQMGPSLLNDLYSIALPPPPPDATSVCTEEPRRRSRSSVVSARATKMNYGDETYELQLAGHMLCVKLQLKPPQLDIFVDGVLYKSTDRIDQYFGCQPLDGVKLYCIYRKRFLRKGLAIWINGVPLEGSFYDPIQELESSKRAAYGLLGVFLIHLAILFFNQPSTMTMILFPPLAILLLISTMNFNKAPRLNVTVALAIGAVDLLNGFRLLVHWTILALTDPNSDISTALLIVLMLLLVVRFTLMVWVAECRTALLRMR